MNKRGYSALIFLIFALLFFTSFYHIKPVAAQSQDFSCSDDQVILRLSSGSNAHGEIWNGAGNYQTEVCYDEIFGSAYAGANPHVCAAGNGNLVLKLSTNTNAHAEGPAGLIYGTNVCYGDLVCEMTTSGAACDPGSLEIVSLSSMTNAHLETANLNNYGFKICCSASFAQWQNLAGIPIVQSNVNSTVKLFGSFPGTPAGTNVHFTVSKAGLFGGIVAEFDSDTNSAGIASYNWKIDDAAMSGNNQIFTFEAAAEGGQTKESTELNVYNIESGNAPPIVTITAPAHRQIYFANTQLNFNALVVDEAPAGVVYNWTITHNSVVEYSSSQNQFSYSFATSGMRTITLRATDSQGLWDEDQVAIVVIGNEGMLAYINISKHLQVIIDSINQNGISHIVKYNSSDSYVISSSGTGCSPTITCLAGICPSQTYNAPATCSLNVSVGSSPQPFLPLKFNWKFYDQAFSSNMNASGLVSGAYSYPSPSTKKNDKKIDLTLSYDAGGVNLQESTTRAFTLGQCVDNGLTYLNIDSQGNILQELNTLDPNNQGICKGADGLAGSADDCCPNGFTCGGNGCVAPSSTITQCAQYTNEDDCEDDEFNVASPPAPLDPNWVNQCGDTLSDGTVVQCNCGWNSTANEGDGLCNFEMKFIDNPIVIDGEPCVIGTCQITSDPNAECVNGYVTIDPTSSYVGGNANCQQSAESQAACTQAGEVKTVPCGKLNFELGLFDMRQFVASAIAIFLIYLGVYYRRKE